MKSLRLTLDDLSCEMYQLRDMARAISTAIIEGPHDSKAYEWALIKMTSMACDLSDKLDNLLNLEAKAEKTKE